MDKIQITGGVPLKGKIKIGGAKNAALPLMAASILTEDTLTLSNIPHLSDIVTMANLLTHHGVKLKLDGVFESKNMSGGRVIELTASNITSKTAPYDIVRKMRASVLVLGPILARFGEAKVSLPGGCSIGTRPIDMHLEALKKMGAKIKLEEGYVIAKITSDNGRLQGAEVEFPKVTVGGTENILMAATLAEGKTVIKNAAMEPEIADLADCLIKMGAKIEGIGTSALIIEGVEKLKGASHTVLSDRIEAGTYAIAAGITNGEIELVNANRNIMESTISVLEEVGMSCMDTEKGILVKRNRENIQPINVETSPYPGFATDMQAQMMALMCLAKGKSQITESIFENRFMHVPELIRMGADIEIDEKKATVNGVEKLRSAQVMATDLRASVSLVLAALAAEGTTVIGRVYHIDRGYEYIEEKLRNCGAKIERVNG